MELAPWHRGLIGRVAEDGYEIAPRRELVGLRPHNETEEFLIPKSERWREVRGLRADLYRTITDDLSRESFPRLAGQYGALGTPVPTFPPRGGGKSIEGDRLEGWLDLWKLRMTVRLFDLAQEGDRVALEPMIKWTKAGRANLHLRRQKDQFQLLPAWVQEYGEAIEGAPHNIVDAALGYVRQQINKHLSNVWVRLIYPETGEHSLMLRPPTLEAALWLQFAEAVIKDKQRSRCKHCDKWFDPVRSDQEFCSANCRINHHQKSKRQQYKGVVQ
jgi:hypothetical protein